MWVGDVLLLDAHRRPTSAALLGLGTLVVLAFVVAFVLGTQAPRASGGTATRTAAAPATGTTGAGPAMTSLRLDPVPTLPDLQGSARTRSPRLAQAAPPLPETPASDAPSSAPVTAPTPISAQPVAPPVTRSRPAPPRKPKPSSGPSGEKFDSSG